MHQIQIEYPSKIVDISSTYELKYIKFIIKKIKIPNGYQNKGMSDHKRSEREKEMMKGQGDRESVVKTNKREQFCIGIDNSFDF